MKLGRIKVSNTKDPNESPTIYLHDQKTNTLYDHDSYKKQSTLVKVGRYNPEANKIELVRGALCHYCVSFVRSLYLEKNR